MINARMNKNMCRLYYIEYVAMRELGQGFQQHSESVMCYFDSAAMWIEFEWRVS